MSCEDESQRRVTKLSFKEESRRGVTKLRRKEGGHENKKFEAICNRHPEGIRKLNKNNV